MAAICCVPSSCIQRQVFLWRYGVVSVAENETARWLFTRTGCPKTMPSGNNPYECKSCLWSTRTNVNWCHWNTWKFVFTIKRAPRRYLYSCSCQCECSVKACPHQFPKQDRLYPETSDFVGNRRLCCRFWQQSHLFPDTKYPVSRTSVDRPFGFSEDSVIMPLTGNEGQRSVLTSQLIIYSKITGCRLCLKVLITLRFVLTVVT